MPPEIESMSSPRLSRRAFTLACASAALAACTSTGTKPTTGAATPTNPTQPREKPIRVGVALGGGAARGFAHVGVLKALEARGIPVELVAGTSAGSVVGALYASGMNALQINKLALTMDEASISDWATPFRSRGLLQGIALQNFINKTLNNRPIEKMAKPLGIVATDLKSGQPILFQRGNTGLAVRASCSVPSVFEPVRIGDREYVDGGLVSPVPASFARKMGADFVIAVDISSRPDGAATGNPIEMLLQTFTIMGQTIKTYELDKYADVVIRPNLAAMGGSDFNQRNAAILAGEEAVARIREQVGDEEVILGLSGGVDSSVAAALIHRAIGDQLTCVFVDHGLLRLNEGKMVLDMFEGRLHAKVVHVDASEQFLSHLAGVADPEHKRKIIGREFVEVFQAEAKKLTNAKWLAQGTIYPDVIESGGAKTKKATTIKSHHNVGGLPETLGLKLLEPLRDLFKDEVRELGVALGLPAEMVYRHPFPGPGLGVRILGEVKRDYAELLRRADAIFIEELRGTLATEQDAAAGLCEPSQVGKSWYDLTSQAFAVFLPVKSVGVMGDGRTYDYVAALRAVQTTDFMTAHWAHLPYALLGRASNRIINEVRGINRVVYDVSGKPPATIEWE